MPNFFHVAGPGLRVGEIIQPGKWGRETLAFAQRGRRGIQQDSDAINLIWEAALEAARIVRFPEATSRLDCVFACFQEEDARAFRDRFRPDHKIYGVELINPATPVTIGDYGAITDAEPGPYVEMAAQIAATYWNALKPRFPEALLAVQFASHLLRSEARSYLFSRWSPTFPAPFEPTFVLTLPASTGSPPRFSFDC